MRQSHFKREVENGWDEMDSYHESFKDFSERFSPCIPKKEEEKIETNSFRDILNHVRIKATEHYEAPQPSISVKGIVIATVGNFSASIGKPKSRKTYNVSAITAAMLSGKEIIGYKASMPEGKPKILYVDTEQSRIHCQYVLKRIIKMAEISDEEADERIAFVMLREFSPCERRDIIDLLLEHNQDIGFVVIDGIRDLLNDINSPVDSTKVITDLMRWTQSYNIHIHTVLHTNKNDDNARGHIGTELNNKAETVLRVSKNPTNPAISEVRAMISRDKSFGSFNFCINDDGLPELTSEEGFEPIEKVSLTNISPDEHKVALDAVFAAMSTYGYGALILALQKEYAEIGYFRSRTSFVELLKLLMNTGVVVKEQKCYTYNPDNIQKLNS